MCAVQGVSTQLPSPTAEPVCCHATHTIIDSNPLEPQAKIKVLFYELLGHGVFNTITEKSLIQTPFKYREGGAQPWISSLPLKPKVKSVHSLTPATSPESFRAPHPQGDGGQNAAMLPVGV